MTDLPELIANVYRACGKPIETPVVYPNGDICFAYGYSKMRGYIGLDVFVRDIVPTLNERGWEPAFTQEVEPPPSDWDCQLYEIRSGANVGGARGKTPVEACFRAAWEALIPGENP